MTSTLIRCHRGLILKRITLINKIQSPAMISQFYEGKTIFITGCTGFLGKCSSVLVSVARMIFNNQVGVMCTQLFSYDVCI